MKSKFAERLSFILGSCGCGREAVLYPGVLWLQMVALKVNGHADGEGKDRPDEPDNSVKPDGKAKGEAEVRDSTSPHGTCHRADAGGSGMGSANGNSCGRNDCKEEDMVSRPG